MSVSEIFVRRCDSGVFSAFLVYLGMCGVILVAFPTQIYLSISIVVYVSNENYRHPHPSAHLPAPTLNHLLPCHPKNQISFHHVYQWFQRLHSQHLEPSNCYTCLLANTRKSSTITDRGFRKMGEVSVAENGLAPVYIIGSHTPLPHSLFLSRYHPSFFLFQAR